MEYLTHFKDLGISGAMLATTVILFMRTGAFLGPMIRTLFETLVSTLTALQDHSARHTDLLASLVDSNALEVAELKEHRELLTQIHGELKNGPETRQGKVAEDRQGCADRRCGNDPDGGCVAGNS